jgi:hypothetical protein
MTKKLLMLAACVAALGMGSGVAYADDDPTPSTDSKPAPQAGSPLCNVMGGDDGTKWELAPCGWAYGEEKGWYQVP